MDDFEPLRDFYGRRLTLRRQALSARLPLVILNTFDTNRHYQSFLHPNPHITCHLRTPVGQQVGTLKYGVNPLGDRLYVFYIEIAQGVRRQGYGLSALWTIAQLHPHPLVPNCINGGALGFWKQARETFGRVGVTITDDYRSNHMEKEKARWAHLVSESPIDRSVREHEGWVEAEKAAGRLAEPSRP